MEAHLVNNQFRGFSSQQCNQRHFTLNQPWFHNLTSLLLSWCYCLDLLLPVACISTLYVACLTMITMRIVHQLQYIQDKEDIKPEPVKGKEKRKCSHKRNSNAQHYLFRQDSNWVKLIKPVTAHKSRVWVHEPQIQFELMLIPVCWIHLHVLSHHWQPGWSLSNY